MNGFGIKAFTAVPIKAFRKMLISSFPRLEELLNGVPQHFKEVPQKPHDFLFRLANHINFLKQLTNHVEAPLACRYEFSMFFIWRLFILYIFDN